jgi:hypothetical protein
MKMMPFVGSAYRRSMEKGTPRPIERAIERAVEREMEREMERATLWL